MLPIVQIGPLAIQVPGLLLLAGLWVGLTLAERYAKKIAVDANQLYNLVFNALLAGVVGARLAYVAQFPGAFASSPASLFSLNPGLLDPIGGIAAAVIIGLIYAQRKHLPCWSTLDALTPVLAVLSIASGLANLAAGNSFGAPTDVPWSIELWGTQRHPAQLYEAVTAGIILVITWLGSDSQARTKPGVYFLTFLALSALARLFLEAFRGDSLLMFGGLRTTQLAALLFLIACLIGLRSRLRYRSLPDVSMAGDE